ncbi:MAG: hypothetical protein ACRD3J_22190, partial [Thermoanaerobaculia bacterium]
PGFLEGDSAPLAQLFVTVDDETRVLGSESISWERAFGWIPTFSCRVADLTVRGTICAPHGANADIAGVVISVSFQNKSGRPRTFSLGLRGTFGHRQLRIRTPRDFADGNSVIAAEGNSILLEGASAESPLAFAIGGDGDFTRTVTDAAVPSWQLEREVTLANGETHEAAFHLAGGPERDGAMAVLSVMRRRGAKALVDATRETLGQMEPTTGNASVDRLVSRHFFFSYFCSVARAIDDAHVYVMRSRVPWNGRGVTIRDWDALMWVLPAIQLADQSLARELLLRVCELHGYAPGGGVHYVDGSLFEPGFSLEGAAAYAIAVDSYIVQTSDDKIVEEPALADSLYGSHDDIEARRHNTHPLYSTEVNPDGSV